jgi:hypothetical protein
MLLPILLLSHALIAGIQAQPAHPPLLVDDLQSGSPRLLFQIWPRGYALGIYDTVLKDTSLFLNYDKVSRTLYFTADGKAISKVRTAQIRELHFQSPASGQTVLTRVDGIDPREFFQQLSDSAGGLYYILYRRLETHFRRGSYYSNIAMPFTDGYGEYIDTYKYYLVMPGGREYTPVRLKRRSVLDIFGPAADAWLATRGKGEPDEAGLIQLVNQLNTTGSRPLMAANR